MDARREAGTTIGRRLNALGRLGLRLAIAAVILSAWLAPLATSGQPALADGGCGVSIYFSQSNSTVCYSTIQDAVNVLDVGGGGTITLGAGTFAGGVTVSSNDYNITIQGQGAGTTTLSGDGGTNSGNVFNAQCCGVTLANVTVTGGTNSGIVDQDGTLGGLILQNVTVTGNGGTYGGGIAVSEDSTGNPATLTLKQSTVTGNWATKDGGGIFGAAGDLASLFNMVNLDNSTVSFNCAGYSSISPPGVCSGAQSSGNGGGLSMTNGEISMSGSTINNNTAVGNGGGVYNSPQSADGYAFNEIWKNSTIADNNSDGYGGGVDDYWVGQGENVILTGVTVAGNSALHGGGLSDEFDPYGGGGTEIDSTIIADNSILPGGSGVDCSAENPIGDILDYQQIFDGFPVDGTPNNLIGNNSGCGFYPENDGDQVGAPADPIDPRLGPLANNGGPTETMALGTGSPAIGTGDALMCGYSGLPIGDVDQRGDSRIIGSRQTCDVGAYDTGGSSTTASGAPRNVSAIANPGAGSVSWSAPANDGGSAITGYEITCSPYCGSQVVGPSTFSATVSGLRPNIPYQMSVSAINAIGVGTSATSSSFTPYSIWYINADSGQDPSSSCSGNSQATPYKTIQYVVANCLGNDDFIHLESAQNSYAGGFTINQTVTLEGDDARSTVIKGGDPAITVGPNGNLSVYLVTITGATQAIDNQGGTLNLDTSTIQGNSGATNGAGIENDNGVVTINGSTIAGNQGENAGAIYTNGSNASLTAVNSTITQNSNTGYAQASAVDIEGGVVHMTSDTIAENHSPANAYAVAVHDQCCTFTLVNSILANNTGPGGYGWDCDYDVQGAYDIVGESCGGFYYPATNAANYDLVGFYPNNEDPMVGPLANNGGPTDTLALSAGSPAIGAGDPATCLGSAVNNLDQRYSYRNAGPTTNSGPNNRGVCDIGAYDTGGNSPAPAAPGNVTAQSGDLSATLIWTAPTDGGSPITGYTIACSPDCSGSAGLSVDGNTTNTAITGLTAGTQYTFTVDATNASGTGEISSPSTTVMVKSLKPNAPTLQLDPASDTGVSNSDGVTSDATPTFTGSADPGISVNVYVDGGANPVCTDTSDSASGAWSCTPSTPIADGTHTVAATADNGNGASDPSAALTITIDTQDPSVNINSNSEPAAVTNTSSANLNFTIGDSSDSIVSYTCTLDGSAQPCASSTAAPAYTALGDGAHTFTAQAIDLAGNTGTASYTWTVDTTAPTSMATGSLADTGASYSFAASGGIGPWTNDAAGVKVHLSAGDANGNLPVAGVKAIYYSATGAQTIPATSVNNNSADVVITAPGTTTLSYYAIDNAGNEEAAKTVTVQIDTSAPTLNPTVSPNPVVLDGQATASPGAADNLSGVASSSCDSPVTSSVGTGSVNCTATDLAGNTGAAKASYNVTYGVQTVAATDRLSLLGVGLKLQDANGLNESLRHTTVTVLCIVPTTTPATTSCSSAKAINQKFAFLPLMGGVYAYAVVPKGLVENHQYDLLFSVSGDPVTHAITFTAGRSLKGLSGIHVRRSNATHESRVDRLKAWRAAQSKDN